MYFRPDTTFSKLIIPPLNTVSILFKIISWLHLNIKALKKTSFEGALIISIDNLAFGGTGKTPLIMEIGRALEKQGVKFAVVSRGYRSKYENTGITVTGHHRVSEVGDEAALLKCRFPQQDILIGKNRKHSIRLAIRMRNKVILMDDGFQSTDIAKDVKIMLFNPQHPYFYLRNFKRLMKSEDIILSYLIKADVEGKTKSGVYHFEIEGFHDLKDNRVEIGDSRFVGFSAVGDNERFRRDLQPFNCVAFQAYPDHFSYSEKELARLENYRQEQQAQFLVCTEKDFIKIKNLHPENIPLIYVKNRIKFNFDLIGIIFTNAKEKGFIQTPD